LRKRPTRQAPPLPEMA